MTDVRAVQEDKADDLAFKRHAYAVQLFQNEVGRLWQRSLFFWGFIAAAFVAYGTLLGKDAILVLSIACFGLICSVAWTLLNRASTWSQSYWVKRVDHLEHSALKIRILTEGVPQPESQEWWGGWRYSTTKLAIALSDLTVIAWLALVLKSSVPLLQATPPQHPRTVLLILAGTIAYIFLIVRCTRSDHPVFTRPDSNP